MASEIRVDKINSLSGVGTVTLSPTGVDISGITTVQTLKVGTGLTASEDGDVFFTGVCTATTFTGSGANLTNLTAGNLTGALPAISGANLTGIAATDNVRTGILDVAGIATFRNDVNIGAAVTISESGIEASGIGITCANINGTQIGGRRNIIINGAAMVAQRGDTTSGSTTGGYATDRFQCVMNESGTLTISQDSDAPTGSGFRKCHRLTQTTATGSVDANDLTTFRYNAEGYDLQGFKKGTSSAEEFTVSFWVKSVDQSSYPVTYILELRDPVNTRSCCKAYTVTASDTWEYKTITFPADTSGQWATSNAKALEMNWFVCAGSNYTGGTLSTSWASTVNANRAQGLTANLSGNTANRFYLTGVQLEVGSQATAFEHRSYGEELKLCQRYYYMHANGATSGSAEDAIGTGTWYSGSEFYTAIHFPTTMRTKPSLDQASGSNYYYQNNAGGGGGFNDFTAVWTAGLNMVFLSKTGSSGTQGASAMVRTGSTSAKLGFSAEL